MASQMFGRRLGLGVAAGLAGCVAFSGIRVANCETHPIEPPAYEWWHSGFFGGFDHAAIRRGHKVYAQVCSTCHSLDRIAYRNLVDICYTAAEAKAIAKEIEVQDGPDQEGEMFGRPGLLSDYFPRPYPNANAARFANNGALPPDLSLIIKAREHREDYVFSLLTGYMNPPAGVTVRDGLYYNPYFPGGKIAMAPPLSSNGQVDYDDGTEASISQMAKDVTTFLTWAAEPDLEDRKRKGVKAMAVVALLFVPLLIWKRHVWAMVKTRIVEMRYP